MSDEIAITITDAQEQGDLVVGEPTPLQKLASRLRQILPLPVWWDRDALRVGTQHWFEHNQNIQALVLKYRFCVHNQPETIGLYALYPDCQERLETELLKALETAG